jgi:hypothetical protein
MKHRGLALVVSVTVAVIAVATGRRRLASGPAIASSCAQTEGPEVADVASARAVGRGTFSTIVEIVQLNSAVVAFLIASEWLNWTGYATYFSLTPDQVGLTTFLLLLGGALHYALAVALFAWFFFLERISDRLRPRVYWALIITSVCMAVVFAGWQAWEEGAAQFFINIGVNLLTTLLILAVAATIVRRKGVILGVAIILAVASVTIAGIRTFQQGKVVGKEVVDSYPRGGVFESTFGIPTHFVVGKRVRGVDGTPSNCGLILGVSNGSYTFLFPEPGSNGSRARQLPSANSVWFVPVDSAVLEPC